MKKITLLFVISAFSFSMVNADVLPDYKPNEKLINGKNIVNVQDFPNWIFFERRVSIFGDNYGKINDDGILGCGSLYFGWLEEIWATKDKNVGDILSQYTELGDDKFFNLLYQGGAIKVYDEKDLKLLNCDIVVSKTYEGDEVVNNIMIDPKQLGFGEFYINTSLLQEEQDTFKIVAQKAFEQLESYLENSTIERQNLSYATLIAKLNELLTTDKRKEIVFTFSYLQFLAKKAING